MITVLTGDDSFAISERLSEITAAFDGQPERIDGTSIALRDIPDLLMGSSLFSDKRLVIIRDLASNTALWHQLPEWVNRVSDDIHLVLVDTKLDKRTTGYKALQQASEINELLAWGDRDRQQAVRWLRDRAVAEGLTLESQPAQYLVDRVGLDKWQLAQAIEMLSLLDEPITEQVIDRTLVASISENVFDLYEEALLGRTARVQEIIRTLEMQEEAYAVFALISSQTFQLLGLARAKEGDSPEKDLGIHPFVASKLRQHVRRLSPAKIEKIAKTIADTDTALKSTSTEPWLLVERALLFVATK